MRLIYVIVLFVSSGAAAQGQSSCSEAAKEARKKCAAALREVSSLQPGAAATTNSISGGASLQTAMMSFQSAKLNEAIEFCKQQRQRCEGRCGSGGNGEGQTAGNTHDMGKTGMGNDLDNKSPAYIAAHRRCLDQGTKLCTTPLMIQLGDQQLEMTAAKDGAIFDLLDAKGFPSKAPQKISWLNKASRSGNYFLALPNEKGEITGLKELFGNKTLGPDQKLAEHGWAALKKYNSNGDAVIDKKDAIFTRLRLWADLNGDGKVDAKEIFTLAEKQVEAIHLNFRDDKPEVDHHGNQMAMKSSVKMKSGETKLIFDLIFAPSDQAFNKK